MVYYKKAVNLVGGLRLHMNIQLPTKIEYGSRAELFRELNANIPLNDYNLPDFVYRADMIPNDLFDTNLYSSEQRRDLLQAGSLRLTFQHGYPSIEEGIPFWEQLPAEPIDAYNTFVLFLELPEKTVHEVPIRMLHHIKAVSGYELSRIIEWCQVYCWHWRSRSYDLFLAAAHRKQREARIMTIEGKHFMLAEKLLVNIEKIAGEKLRRAVDAMENPESEYPEEFEALDLKALVDMADKLSKVQRISVGLPANGSTQVAVSGEIKHGDAGDVYKNVAKQAVPETATSRRSAHMDALLENPDDLARMQDLMTRLAYGEDDSSTSIDADVSEDEGEEDQEDSLNKAVSESTIVEDLG